MDDLSRCTNGEHELRNHASGPLFRGWMGGLANMKMHNHTRNVPRSEPSSIAKHQLLLQHQPTRQLLNISEIKSLTKELQVCYLSHELPYSTYCHCNCHGVSSGWSSVWHRSNTGLSSTQCEQIPIILGVWPFWLTLFFFRPITFGGAYG